MRVAIRTDASAQIGTGHLKRCLSLAAVLTARGADVRLFVRELGLDLAGLLERFAGLVTRLPEPRSGFTPAPGDPSHAAWAGVSSEEDAEQFASAMKGWRPDWTVLDHYAFDRRWHSQVRKAGGGKLLVIDDLADRLIDADLLVDHNYHRDHRAKYAAWLGRATPILGGLDYALLDPAYSDAPRYAMRGEVQSIGVFMGGADATYASVHAIEAIGRSEFTGPIEVATTSMAASYPALRELAAQNRTVTLSVDQPDLMAFFARHDLQIGAGGGALLERCCIGPPTLAAIVAENQRHSVTPLARLGAVVAVDMLTSAQPIGEMASHISRLLSDREERLRLSQAAQQLCDGRGMHRIVEAMRT